MYLETKERKWILVVDDDEEIRSSLTELIKLNFGKDVATVEAKDGIEATTKINYQKFDCIITDLSMPKKEGEAFIHSVRLNHMNGETPVIVVSGSPNLKAVANSYEFVTVFPKPYKMSQMVEALKVNLKIGGNTQRVSATIFNNIIDGVDQFVNQITSNNLEQMGSLSVKKPGEAVECSRVASIQIDIGKVKNTFSIMMNDIDIEKFKSTCDSLCEKDNQKILESISYVVVRHVLDQAGILKKTSFKASSIDQNKDLLTDKRGLVINMGCDDFNFNIFATYQ